MSAHFPPPDAGALALSQQLTDHIRAALEAAGGWLGFERYMHMVLYQPGLGYYNNASAKLGAEGDFITAPEVSPLFARVLARQIAPCLAALDEPIILELGAGTGRLAQDLVRELDRTSRVAPAYRILEPSPEFRARQRARLAPLADRVRWLQDLPTSPFEGIILANEVVDAFPRTCFIKRNRGAIPLGVAWTADGFSWAEGPVDAELCRAVEALEADLGQALPAGFRSELCPSLPAWVRSVSRSLHKGALVIVDYGLVRREYYHLERDGGTLICHYRHRAHTDPFLYPGLQDVSAWVDFSACARAGHDAGLSVSGFTTQGQFLVEGGAGALIEPGGGADLLRQAQALKTLVLPGEMGERFKVLLLTRGQCSAGLPGRDFRDRL
jgi:SAM-dependent MidA family methyltransferase